MQVIRYKTLAVIGVRHLYSAASLGIDSFLSTKSRIKAQFEELGTNFKAKMNDFSQDDSKNMIFTEDLKHMIHLVDGNDEDLNLVKNMMRKFSKQNKDLRFGSFIFGPVVMRMYYHLDKPSEALEVFKELEGDGFFDQLASYQILMDLLLKHNMYDQVIEIFEIVKTKQLKGSKFPKNAVVLVLAACYKMNTPESYGYAKKLWAELNEAGHYPMRRAGTFAAALAIQQNEPHIGLEILTSIKQQAYVTVRNLKVSALADLGRADDALPILRTVLENDGPNEKKCTICEEVILKMQDAIKRIGRIEIVEEYERLEKQLKTYNHITSTPLSELLCSEIITGLAANTSPNNRYPPKRNANYNLRPSLQDMV